MCPPLKKDVYVDKSTCRQKTDVHTEKIHEGRCTATSRQTDVHTYKETCRQTNRHEDAPISVQQARDKDACRQT